MRDLARSTFVAGTWLVLASVLVRVLLAGLGVFASAGFFFWHASVNSIVVGSLPLLLVLVGWVSRAPRHLLWLAAAVSGLTALQSLLLLPYHMNAQGVLRAISGLHVLNAFLMSWVICAWWSGRAPGRWRRPRTIWHQRLSGSHRARHEVSNGSPRRGPGLTPRCPLDLGGTQGARPKVRPALRFAGTGKGDSAGAGPGRRGSYSVTGGPLRKHFNC